MRHKLRGTTDEALKGRASPELAQPSRSRAFPELAQPSRRMTKA